MRASLSWLLLLLCSIALALSRGSAGPIVPEDGGWRGLPFQAWPGLRPLRVSAGPLLVMRSWGPETYVEMLDPEHSFSPQSTGLRSQRQCQRLDRDHVLVDVGRLAVWELSTARLCPLPGFELVSQDSDSVSFFDDSHCLRRVSGGVVKRPSERCFTRVLGETARDFVAVTEGGEVWAVSKGGGQRCLARVSKSDWGVIGCVSPDESMIALGALLPQSLARFQVIDLESGAVRFEKSGVPVSVSYASSLGRTLDLLWRGDQRLCYSYTERTDEPDPAIPDPTGLHEGFFRWAEVDVTTGEVSELGRYACIGLYHEMPRPLVAESGALVIRDGALCHRSTGRLLRPRPYSEWLLTLSHDGSWATFADGDYLPEIVDSGGGGHTLGKSYMEFEWLPAVGPVTELRLGSPEKRYRGVRSRG